MQSRYYYYCSHLDNSLDYACTEPSQTIFTANQSDKMQWNKTNHRCEFESILLSLLCKCYSHRLSNMQWHIQKTLHIYIGIVNKCAKLLQPEQFSIHRENDFSGHKTLSLNISTINSIRCTHSIPDFNMHRISFYDLTAF